MKIAMATATALSLLATDTRSDNDLTMERAPSGTFKFAPNGDDYGRLATIPSDGSARPVMIDWHVVEQAAAHPGANNHAIAVMMIAIRDGTWQPMGDAK